MSDEAKKCGDEGECGSGKCGSGGGCGSCGCAKKIIAVLVLLLLGGVIGYLCGSHCRMKSAMCPMGGSAMMTPAAPPASK